MSKAHQVVIVEDDVEVRAALTQLFSSKGCDVEVADNGAEAIELLDLRSQPCVVIVDLLMPGIVGHELLDYMRADEKLASIPVAIVSGSPQLAPPGYHVFPKPVDSRALVEFVFSSCLHAHEL
jgi:CheY-like chemotaxis protein